MEKNCKGSKEGGWAVVALLHPPVSCSIHTVAFKLYVDIEGPSLLSASELELGCGTV